MFNHLHHLKKLEQWKVRGVSQFLRRHWLISLCVAGLAGVLWIGAPVWAAPVVRPLNQTVPRPTPTSAGAPVATATPRPDDADSGEDAGDNRDAESDGGSTSPADAPNIVFPQDSDDRPSTDSSTGPAAGGSAGSTGPAASLTAQVTVNALNLREGAGTAFNTLGNLPANTQVTVLSRSEDGAWWYVCCLPGTTTRGWVSAQLLTPDFDRAQADTLLQIFGSEPAAPAAATPQPTTQSLPQVEQPLEVDFGIAPYFVWQGITATVTITVNNPNAVDAINVVLSDELPEALTLIEADADAGGTVETVTTATERELLLFHWESIPADTAVTATIVAQVSPDITDGSVIDNLVATSGANVTYGTDVFTLGMPPVVPPDFQ